MSSSLKKGPIPVFFSFLLALLAVDWCLAAERPNFIVIFTDDQGYNDLGCFGSPNIRTPHIDRMATEGMRFTSFYSAASVCTPSRAALLTGCYPERVGNLPVVFPTSDRGLNPAETTIAELLKEQGYATACIGKWHLGHHAKFLPTEHGFDSYFGIPYSNDMGVDGSMQLAADVLLREGRTAADFRANRGRQPPLMRGDEVIEWPADQTQLTRRYTQEAQAFITAHAEAPFFLYLPHTMPHIPLYVSDDFRGSSEIGLYGDAVQEIDWSVGEIVKTLRALNIDERTLVVYTSDNGPWNLKGNATDKVKGNGNRSIGGSAHPLKGYKFSNWEGGMRVPCVMWWPGRIPPGTTCDEVAGTIDLLPTFAALSGAAPSSDRPIDGASLIPLLEGRPEAKSPHEAYFYRTNGVRSGKWKYINRALFDLEGDISEARDVAQQHPEVVRRLQTLLEAHRSDMHQNGRPPGYYQRPMHPLRGLEEWTVIAGRWSLRKGTSFRQQSDWLDAQVMSPRLASPGGQFEVEAQQTRGEGGFELGLHSDGEVDVTFRVGANGNTQHVLRGTRERAILATATSAGAVTSSRWYRLRLTLQERRVDAFVDDELMATIELPQPLDVRYLTLGSLHARADFRNLRVTSTAGDVLLELLLASQP